MLFRVSVVSRLDCLSHLLLIGPIVDDYVRMFEVFITGLCWHNPKTPRPMFQPPFHIIMVIVNQNPTIGSGFILPYDVDWHVVAKVLVNALYFLRPRQRLTVGAFRELQQKPTLLAM